MANEQVNRQINIFIQTGEAQKAYDKLIAKEKELNKQLKETSDPVRMQKLNAELKKLEEPISRAAKKLNGELKPSLREQEALVKKLGAALKHMSTNDADFSKAINQYKQAKIELAGLKTEIDGVAKVNPFSKLAGFAKDALIGGGLIGAVVGITNFIKGSFDEALDAEEIGARLKATLDNLGRSDAFDRINKRADELAAKFKYLDNDDIVGVFNKLIDYGKLTEKQMNDLLPVIIDFAAKQRISLEESSDVIVKALEGNSKALKTYGINMKDVKDEGERLSVVMGVLKEKVDGAGEAFQETTKGKLAVARQQFADLKEEVGNKLIPVLNSLLTFTNKALAGIPILATKIKNTFSDIGTLFTEGVNGMQAKIAEREAIKLKDAQQRVIASQVAAFNGSSSSQVGDEINRLNALLFQKTNQQKAIKSGAGTDEDLKNVNTAIAVVRGTLEGLYKLQDDNANKEVLGIPGTEGAKKSSTSKKVNQTVEDLKKLYKDLAKLRAEQATENESELFKELARERAKYDELEALAHGNKDALKQIDEAWHIEQQQIFDKYAKASLESEKKLSDDKKKLREKQLADGLRKGFAFVDAVGNDLAKNADVSNRDRKALLEMQAAAAHGKKRLQLELQLLDEEERQELAGKNLTENEKLNIEEQYRQKRKEAEQNHLLNQVNTYLQFAQQIVGVLDSINSAKTARENAELERDRKNNDRKKSNLDRQLKAGILSREQYDKKIEQLDKQQEAKEKEARIKQFRRDQRMQVIQAVMNGAQAVVSTLAARPGSMDIISFGAFRAISIGLALAATAGQIAAIASAKPPAFGRGGRTSGRSHANGGMAVVDEHGNKQAEVEGNEGIINKRSMSDRGVYSLTGTPSQIASKINALHGGVNWESGATLVPVWRTASPARMNFSAINSTYQRKHADGGIVQPALASNGGQNEMLAQVAAAVGALNAQLADGITAFVSLQQLNDQNERLKKIQDDATFKA
jgi:hypothetical protein